MPDRAEGGGGWREVARGIMEIATAVLAVVILVGSIGAYSAGDDTKALLYLLVGLVLTLDRKGGA